MYERKTEQSSTTGGECASPFFVDLERLGSDVCNVNAPGELAVAGAYQYKVHVQCFTQDYDIFRS